jgi:hypothetical protein
MLTLSLSYTPTYAKSIQEPPLCGNGSSPDYGLNEYDLLQPHWTVGWEGYASENTINELDVVLDQLNEDSITQTMILIKPQEEVGIPTNCAVHFLRYMQLGLPSGERKDNGFVFLIVVQPESIDVHYAVGLGLPALTAQELTPINRAVEATYESTHSIDEALLTLAQEFDRVARDNYQPLIYIAATPEVIELPAGPVGIAMICIQLCMGIFVLFILFWLFSQIGQSGMSSGPYGSRPWGGGFGGFPSGRSHGPQMRPRMRGGSGSGRSGRTN